MARRPGSDRRQVGICEWARGSRRPRGQGHGAWHGARRRGLRRPMWSTSQRLQRSPSDLVMTSQNEVGSCWDTSMPARGHPWQHTRACGSRGAWQRLYLKTLRHSSGVRVLRELPVRGRLVHVGSRPSRKIYRSLSSEVLPALSAAWNPSCSSEE